MSLRSALIAAAALCSSAALAADPSLSAMDYIQIDQLNAHYAMRIDNCTNKGYDYADLYTADGTFAVSDKWGDPGKVYARGRDELAKAAGGGPDGCRQPRLGGQHILVNHIIEPRPGGAYGRSLLFVVKLAGDYTKNEPQGGYEDFYVKTPQGWRIKSRVHVFPDMEHALHTTLMREMMAKKPAQ